MVTTNQKRVLDYLHSFKTTDVPATLKQIKYADELNDIPMSTIIACIKALTKQGFLGRTRLHAITLIKYE